MYGSTYATKIKLFIVLREQGNAFSIKKYDCVYGSLYNICLFRLTETMQDGIRNLSKPSTLSAARDPWLTELSTVELVVWCVPCGVVALAAIFGNTLVLASFFLSTNIRHQVVIFVAGLAVADVLVGAVSIPLWIYTLFLSWKTRRPAEDIWLTLIYDALDVFAALNSIFHLTAISIERFFATVYPFTHRNITKRLYRALIIAIWMTSAIVSCSFFLPLGKASLEFRFFLLNLLFIIPLIIISFSYAKIWLKAKTGLRNVPDTTKKMSFTLLIVIGLFVLAWTPFFAVRGILHFCRHFCVSWRLFYLTKLFHFSNSAMNPLVYGLRIPEYKVTFCRLLGIDIAIPKRDSVELDSLAVRNSPRSFGDTDAVFSGETPNSNSAPSLPTKNVPLKRSSLPIITITEPSEVTIRKEEQDVIYAECKT